MNKQQKEAFENLSAVLRVLIRDGAVEDKMMIMLDGTTESRKTIGEVLAEAEAQLAEDWNEFKFS